MRRTQSTPEAFIEALESRVMLDAAPFPDLADMVDPLNTVVRMDTTYGVIDIEMFDFAGPVAGSNAPNTVANFLNYVRDGDLDLTFFHRLMPGFVLQGGGFGYNDDSGLFTVPTDDPVANEFSSARSNIERTIAMAKIGGFPDSATSQFFFNLVDNSGILDGQNGGFTVFGRVVDDASWTTVTTISALDTDSFAEEHPALTDTPVRDSHAENDPISEDSLVNIDDIEIIKPSGTTLFYENTVYYPEGFAGSTINEFVPMVNPNDQDAQYQIIVRYETGWPRDTVIDNGTIAANTRGGPTIFQFEDAENGRVPQGKPYAYEVQSTHPVGANLSHFDFGTATGESFTNQTSATWFFPQAEKDTAGDTVQDVLVWQNPNETDVTLTITFYPENSSSITITRTTDALRRDGLNFQQMSLIPDGNFAIRVEADQPIIAALTHYEPAEGEGDSPSGYTMLGAAGDPATGGVVPGASFDSGIDQTIVLHNPSTNTSGAIVFLSLHFEDSSKADVEFTRSELIIQPGATNRLDFSTVSQVEAGDRFTIIFDVRNPSVPIYVASIHTESDDAVASPVATVASTEFQMAEGFMDVARAGTDVRETVFVYNPYAKIFEQTETDANVTITFRYTDGFVLPIDYVVAGGETLFLDIHTLQAVLDQGPQNNRYFFSIEVSADIPVVAQMWHYDLTLGGVSPAGGFGTLGTPFDTVYSLDTLPDPGVGT
jgi:cyclophilin family peptidyl-prolyl cis-trans isomerase